MSHCWGWGRSSCHPRGLCGRCSSRPGEGRGLAREGPPPRVAAIPIRYVVRTPAPPASFFHGRRGGGGPRDPPRFGEPRLPGGAPPTRVEQREACFKQKREARPPPPASPAPPSSPLDCSPALHERSALDSPAHSPARPCAARGGRGGRGAALRGAARPPAHLGFRRPFSVTSLVVSRSTPTPARLLNLSKKKSRPAPPPQQDRARHPPHTRAPTNTQGCRGPPTNTQGCRDARPPATP